LVTFVNLVKNGANGGGLQGFEFRYFWNLESIHSHFWWDIIL